MGSSSSHDWVDLRSANTPLMGICWLSMFFNSVQNGMLRIANVYTNSILLVLLGCSTAFCNTLHMPIIGSQLGLSASLLFTVGAPLKILFTARMFPRPVHYGIGTFYCTYHTLQWRQEANYFEDADEDAEDEKF